MGDKGNEERILIISILRRKIRGKVLFFIPPAILHWFSWKSFPAFSARGMAFQVSCEGLGYKISL